MKTKLLSVLLLFALLGVAGCKDDDDDNTNGVPENTIDVNGAQISLISTCTTHSSSYNLRFTASDQPQDHVLEIYFTDWPTSTRTFDIDNGGSSSEAWGSYTVEGVEYDTQSGTATVTPAGSGFNVKLNNVVAEANNVELTLNFNGTCD